MASKKGKRLGIHWGTPKKIQEEHARQKHGSKHNRQPGKRKWKCKRGKSNQHDWYFHSFYNGWFNWINWRCRACNKHDYDIFPIGFYVQVVIEYWNEQSKVPTG